MAYSPTEPEAVEKLLHRRAPHIILYTVPALSVLTPSHSVHVQLAFRRVSVTDKAHALRQTAIDPRSLAEREWHAVPDVNRSSADLSVSAVRSLAQNGGRAETRADAWDPQSIERINTSIVKILEYNGRIQESLVEIRADIDSIRADVEVLKAGCENMVEMLRILLARAPPAPAAGA